MKIIVPFLILAGIIFPFRAESAVCTALGNGNWSNPATWSCGALPGCGDVILIPAGITVTVDTQVDLDENSSPACSTATFILVSGTLQFVTGFKISLACGSGVEVFPGGSMLPGGGGGASNWLKICSVTQWQTSHGPVAGYKLFGTPFPLPVEFVDFSVELSKDQFKFSWTVASERNNAYFTLEFSEDGFNWEKMKNFQSIGDHGSKEVYTSNFVFAQTKCGTLYFRLSQTDINGAFEILDIKSLERTTDQLKIYPNPVKANSALNLVIPSDEELVKTLHVANSTGQIVLSQEIKLSKGLNQELLDINGIDPGIYFLYQENDSTAVKLIIE